MQKILPRLDSSKAPESWKVFVGRGRPFSWVLTSCCHGSPLPPPCVSTSEGTGAFPGSDIYRMVEQVNDQLKDSVIKILEEERWVLRQCVARAVELRNSALALGFLPSEGGCPTSATLCCKEAFWPPGRERKAGGGPRGVEASRDYFSSVSIVGEGACWGLTQRQTRSCWSLFLCLSLPATAAPFRDGSASTTGSTSLATRATWRDSAAKFSSE